MLYAAKTIHVGDHPHFSLFGLTFDTDIAMSTLLAFLIILFMGWRLRKSITDGVPGKFQLIWEILVVDIVGDLVKGSLATRASDLFRWVSPSLSSSWSPTGLVSYPRRCTPASPVRSFRPRRAT